MENIETSSISSDDGEILESMELFLPINDKINQFKLMNNDVRINCIYAGIQCLDNLEKFSIKTQNAAIHEKMTQLEKKYKKKLHSLQLKHEQSIENGQSLQFKINELQKQHLDDLKSNAENIKTKCSIDFQNTIDELKRTNKELLGNVNLANEKSFKREKEFMIEKEKLIFEHNNKINDMRKEERTYYDNNLRQNNEKMKQLLDNKNEVDSLKRIINEKNQIIENNSSLKGKVGECNMVDILKKYLLNYQIELIGKKESSAGDILIHNSDFKFMVENKDYKKSLPKKEIEKFHKDHKLHPEYNASILINMKESIACHNNLQIEEIDGRFVIYLTYFNNNPSIIRTVITILEQLVSMKKTNGDVAGFLDTINDFLKNCAEKIRENVAQQKSLEIFYQDSKKNLESNIDFYKSCINIFKSHSVNQKNKKGVAKNKNVGGKAKPRNKKTTSKKQIKNDVRNDDEDDENNCNRQIQEYFKPTDKLSLDIKQ